MTADPTPHPQPNNPWFSRPEHDMPPAPHQDPEPARPAAAPSAAGRPDAGPPGAPAPAALEKAVPDGALVAFAVGRLAQGRRPDQAFCDLVGYGTDRRRAAIAVCTANGTPWEVAEARMASFDDMWASLGGGSAETAGGLLELYGYFDREVELTPDEAAIAAALRTAMAAVEYLPSGYANQMYRLLRTGRLREALFSLEEMGGQRWPDNRPFWVSLTDAAVRLDSAAILDTEIAAVRRRCEGRALS